MDEVRPSIGWGVLHLFYRVDRERADRDPGAAKRIVDAVASLQADGHQVLVFAVLGHKADLGVMAYGPDLARLHAFQSELASAPLVPTYSFVSLTERSEYTTTSDDERARLEAEGVSRVEIEAGVAAFAERMDHYVDQRLHPKLPQKAVIGFYPMSKRRDAGANWYELPFDERKRLMGGHARVGRTYAGRVLQLITGATGLDDWEWGVTLLTDDPVVLKEIVNEMRFDEASARYAEFGPFYTGLVLEPAAALAANRALVKPSRLFVAFPEELVSQPMIYEVVKRFDVVPNIRRANVEAHSGWMIMELDGEPDSRNGAIAWLVEQGCTVNPMEGDVVAG